MFNVKIPIARNLRRAALLFFCASSVACSTPAVDGDTPTDASVDRAATSDVSVDRTSTTDASADASIADAGRDASGDGSSCGNVAGSYQARLTCSGEQPFTTTYCISQSGCSATIAVDGEFVRGVVEGNTLTVRDATQSCVITFSGSTAMEQCTLTRDGTMQTCRATLTARTFPGATSYCCNPGVVTSCGAGQRCVLAEEPMRAADLEPFTACVPNGSIAEGMSCTRSGALGADMCVAGTICANFGQPTPAMRVCRRVCGQNRDCRTGEICRRIGFAPSSGFCLPTCTLGGTNCPTGNTCRTDIAIRASVIASEEEVDEVRTSCTHIGTTPLGMPCTNSEQCSANSDCFSDPMIAPSTAICRQTCGPMFACPAGQTCRPRRPVGPENPSALGHCYPN